jgi:cytochrome c
MKKIALIAILAAAVTMPVFAADPAAKEPAEKEKAEKMAKMQEMATKKNCMACHAVDKKLVGPAYKEVAAKYKDQKDAGAKLAEKIQKGGAGAWGQIPMPANPQVNPEEAKQLANWVLSLK